MAALPSYMERIRAHLLAERGMDEAKATSVAIATATLFCRSGQSPNLPVTVNAASRAEACAAVEELQAMKAGGAPAAKEEEPVANISEAPWDGSASNYSDEQYQRACLIDRGGDAPVKERCSLPVLTPSGALSRAGVHAAAAMIGKVKASAELVRKAARALIAAYRQLNEEPPENLVKLAGAAAAAGAAAQGEQRDDTIGVARAGQSTGAARGNARAGDLVVEERSAPDTLTVEGRKLRGRIPFGVESRDLGGWTEVMAPGSLRNVDLADLVATVDHQGLPIGRYPGTLSIEQRDDGLHWSVDLPESRADVREAVERGDLRSSSWRMVVSKDRWDGDRRYVEEVRSLRDVAVVTTSAYPSSAAFAEMRQAPPVRVTEPERSEEEGTMDEHENEHEAEEKPPEGGGGLLVEERSAKPDEQDVESRILDSMRSVPRGESRDLTTADASAGPVTPTELSTRLWDLMRAEAVVLRSGIQVITATTKSIKWPRLTADTQPDFYDELETIDETDPEFDEIDVDVGRGIKARVVGSSEAFDDSNPDLLTLLRANLNTTLALRLDKALLLGGLLRGTAGPWQGLLNTTGSQLIDAADSLDNWDIFIRAIGALRGAHFGGSVAIVMHPYTATHLALLKKLSGSITSNEALARPDDVPQPLTSTQVPRDGTAATASAVVYATAQVAAIRRQEVTIEVDRSEEFSKDAVSVRGKLRARLFTPYPAAICVIENLPAPVPTTGLMSLEEPAKATRKR